MEKWEYLRNCSALYWQNGNLKQIYDPVSDLNWNLCPKIQSWLHSTIYSRDAFVSDDSAQNRQSFLKYAESDTGVI